MVIKVDNVSVVQSSVQLNFPVNLGGKKTGHNCDYGQSCVISSGNHNRCAKTQRLRANLLPLVRFGDARMWDDLGCVNFAGGEVGHLVAFSKAPLERHGYKYQR